MATVESGLRISTDEARWYLPISHPDGTIEERIVTNQVVTNHPRPNVLLETGWGEDDLEKFAWLFGKMKIHLALFNNAYSNVGEDVALKPEVVEATIIEGTTAVMHTVNDRAGRAPGTKMFGIARSKGASDMLVFGNARPHFLRRVGLLAPFAFNLKALGKTPSDWRRETHQRLGEAGLMVAEQAGDISEDTGLLVDKRSRRLFRELNAGLKYARTQDPGAMTRNLYDRGLLDEIVVLEEDIICPEEEYKPILQRVGLSGFTRVIRGGHALLPEAMALMQTATVIRSVVPPNELWLAR